MSQATTTALPCAACKQPVIEKRTVDGALVVLDAATRRLHLCVKRKEVEAAKAKQIAATRAERPRPTKPVQPVKAVRPVRPVRPITKRVDRPARPVRAEAPKPPRKAP